MRPRCLMAKLRILVVCSALILCDRVACAQTGPSVTDSVTNGANTAAELLTKLDQLVEKNQQLEKQNHELIGEINALRQFLAQQTSGLPTASKSELAAGANSAVPPQSTADKQTTGAAEQVSTQSQGDQDDKTLLPQASPGSPAIFGEFNPGRGFTVGRSEYGELNLSGYMAVRYLNQLPGEQSGIDHLGRPVAVDPRQDFQFHRVMLFSQGWLFSPKFQYSTFLWTVQDTNQVAVGGALYYNFGKYMNLGAGWNAYPGTMLLQGSHPYWLSYDRVMADEFFRPYFSQGVFAKGNILSRLEYRWMVGNNNSNLDIPAVKFDRDLSAGFAITWLLNVDKSPVSSTFGFYSGQLRGQVFTIGVTGFY